MKRQCAREVDKQRENKPASILPRGRKYRKWRFTPELVRKLLEVLGRLILRTNVEDEEALMGSSMPSLRFIMDLMLRFSAKS